MPRHNLSRQFRIPDGVDLRQLNRALMGQVESVDEKTRAFLDGEEGRAITALVKSAMRKRSRGERA